MPHVSFEIDCLISTWALIQVWESVRVEGFNSSDVFELVQQTLAENGAELTKKVGGVILVKVKGKNKVEVSWIIDAKNHNGSVRIAEPGDIVSFFFYLLKTSIE